MASPEAYPAFTGVEEGLGAFGDARRDRGFFDP
jgi:hypothetical protein